jgi:uncharacterized protein YihD (DUF1040 family)
MSGYRSNRGSSAWGSRRGRQAGTVCLGFKRLEDRWMLSGITLQPPSTALALAAPPGITAGPAQVAAAIPGVDSIRSLTEQVRQEALALHESIQQGVETGIQKVWADDFPSSVRTVVDDIGSAIRNQVQMFLSQSSSLTEQVRQRALALHESVQQGVETGTQKVWADDFPASVRTVVDDLAAAIRSQVQTFLSQSRSMTDQIRQSALALHESIQQNVETGTQKVWADDFPSSVHMAADDIGSAIRSQVQMSLSESRSLADQIRSQIFAELGRD